MLHTASMVKLSPTSYVVLGMIAMRGPSTSYDLKRAISHSVGYFWPFPHAQLYSEPKSLVAAGLLAVTIEQDGRRRQTYTITEAGRREVQRWLAQPTREQMQVRDIAELKLFFSELAQPADLLLLAKDQVVQHRERIRVYEDMEDRFGDRADVAARMIPLRLGLELERAALLFWQDFEAEQSAASSGGSAGEGSRTGRKGR